MWGKTDQSLRLRVTLFFSNPRRLKKIILEPQEVKVTKNQIKRLSRDLLEFDIKKKSIIIAIVNTSSGGQQGIDILKQLYSHLNPLQVIDLLSEGLLKLHLFVKIPDLKILVAGGDGTISTVIDHIKTKIPEWSEAMPGIAILPLGTGNDLSRSLGWGGSLEKEDLIKHLKKVQKNAVNVELDRWAIDIIQNN